MTPLRGLYAITSESICADAARLAASITAALRGGARLIQYRDKWNEPAARLRNARMLVELCHAHAARLIINDDAALALEAGADGVHLGANDTPLAQARELLPPGTLVGVTCSNSPARIAAAAAAGADYAALGRFFESRTKPQAPPVSLQQLRDARAGHPRLALCAIGGITPDNAAPLIAAGADLVAAVEGVFGTPDIEAACRSYCRLF